MEQISNTTSEANKFNCENYTHNTIQFVVKSMLAISHSEWWKNRNAPSPTREALYNHYHGQKEMAITLLGWDAVEAIIEEIIEEEA